MRDKSDYRVDIEIYYDLEFVVKIKQFNLKFIASHGYIYLYDHELFFNI